jgi:WD40 repeat protein
LKNLLINKIVRILNSLKIFQESFFFFPARILSIAWHKDEEVIVTGGIDNIRIWDVKSGQVSQRISIGRMDRHKETLVWCLAITS